MAIVVGDIHGNVEKVRVFLDYRPEQEHIALGDYFDSFYEPLERQLECLQLLLYSPAVLLWGNHDLQYLSTPPWYCLDYQHGSKQPLVDIIEANKWRFKAAYAVDGWLCTHAGVHVSIAKRKSVVPDIADRLNAYMSNFLENPVTYQQDNFIASGPPIFNVGKRAGHGNARFSGIFWFDFQKETGLAPIKQIFAHTELSEPVVAENFVALDTSNVRDKCWLYDTVTNELVMLDLL